MNVAAVNYHFGDKEQLYLETLRFCYRTCGVLNERGNQILQRAIDQERFFQARRTVGLSFCRTSQPQDVPAGYTANTDPASQSGPPVVYHLFGKIGPFGR